MTNLRRIDSPEIKLVGENRFFLYESGFGSGTSPSSMFLMLRAETASVEVWASDMHFCGRYDDVMRGFKRNAHRPSMCGVRRRNPSPSSRR